MPLSKMEVVRVRPILQIAESVELPTAVSGLFTRPAMKEIETSGNIDPTLTIVVPISSWGQGYLYYGNG